MSASNVHENLSRGGRAGRLLAAAFGATTLMWLFSYAAIIVPGAVTGDILFGLAILSLLGGGAVAGREDGALPGGQAILRGMGVGAIAAGLNLLVVASLLRSDLMGGLGWVMGILIGCVVVGAAGGLLGHALKPWRSDGNWLTLFCWVATGLTFFMIITGGIVTGFEAGLAVPDWPNSYGHNMLLYPLSEMVADPDGGVFFEHAHRLTGMFVGMTAMVLCVVLWAGDRRLWVSALGTAILLLVIVQGVLGGLRVTGVLTLSQDAADLAPSTTFAVIHGVLAQIILCLMAITAACTSSRWRGTAPVIGEGRVEVDRQLSVVLVVLVLLQLIIGAAYRHMVTEVGPRAPGATHALMAHIGIAVLVLGLGVIVGLRGCAMEGRDRVFMHLGRVLLGSVGLQIVLGFVALAVVMQRPEIGTTADVPPLEVMVTTAHQANGALLFVSSVLLFVWYLRVPRSALT